MRLNLYGNQPIITPRDPELPMEAANKNYVDNLVQSHADDLTLHLTASQNTLLDNLTVTYQELNAISGISGNIQGQIDSKVSKDGDVMSGYLILVGDPTAGLHAATKQYVDTQDALKVSKAGDTMTGPLVLPSDPTTALEASTKQYVDSKVATHAANDELHITAGQNTFLDALTVTSTEVNQLAGVTSNVQTTLDSKFDKSGGVITGNVTFSPDKTIYISKIPTDSTEVVNKTYVDSLVRGLKWEDPISDLNLVNDTYATPPLNPVLGDLYIIAGPATDDWVGKEGFATYKNELGWVYIQDRPVEVGDRFGVSLTSATVPGGGLTGLDKSIVTITSAIPGAITYEQDTLTPGSTTLVFDPQASKFGVTYTLTDEGNWIPTNTSVNLSAGDGLVLTGNILNFVYGNGLENNNDVIEVKLDSSNGLNFDVNGAIYIPKDGGTITISGNGIKVSDAVMTDIADRISSTGVTTVTGSITVDATGSLETLFNPTTVSSVVNKGYVDDADTLLQTQITGINSVVTSLNTDPVTKDYVDTQDALKVNKAGDTMTGPLVLPSDPTAALQASTKQYVDVNLASHALNENIHITASQNTFLDTLTVTSTEVNYLSGIDSNVQDQIDSKLNLTGGTVTGFITLNADPTAGLHAATKQYVDTQDALKVNKAGDTMTGPLVLPSDPTTALQASTKQYVDSNVASLTSYVDTQDALKVNKSGDTMTGLLTLSGDPTLDMHASTKLYVDTNILNTKSYVDAADAILQGQINTVTATVDSLNADPVTKMYVDTQDAKKVDKAGDTMTGYLTLHADPVQTMHAVTKRYVDSIAQGLASKPAVRLATTGNLDATYNNGSFGVNSTLTGNINAELVVDGKSVVVGDRILVRVQTNKAENGDYVVQQTGNVSTPFILKRVETVDESNEIPSSFFYVADGDTLEGTGWTLVVDDPITFSIGTDDINVHQFSGQGNIIAGEGLTLDGNTIKVNTANPSRIVVNADDIDLAPTGVTPGNYTKVQVDGYGRVLVGSNPNTLAGYGITDGQPLNANLTSISDITTIGIIVRSATNDIVTKAITVNGVGLSITNGSGGNSGNIEISSNATSSSTPDTIVSRDASGNFTANIITANLNGNANTATALESSRLFKVDGDVTSPEVSFNGTAGVTLTTTLTDTGVTAGTYTKLTVDAKGRVTDGVTPSNISDIGITDVYTKAEVDAIVSALRAEIAELHMYILSRI